MAADVAQWKRSNIKCYASAFSNILIRTPKRNSSLIFKKKKYKTLII